MKEEDFTCVYPVQSLFIELLLKVSKLLKNLSLMFFILQNICIPLLWKSYIKSFRNLYFFIYSFFFFFLGGGGRVISGIMCFHFLLYRIGPIEFSATQETKIIKRAEL